ncbi:exodeoxyribonuclease I [Celerinatantimonas diazotrophica]|uniref:Exodeoxyribonuclease I n=1 Tax=Celerinatantimonas diazotrophica TaxID=412034 RepID=A0A4R1JAK5_9GAMM|nr:exodeoxyribonuclease I [Celerinatantimonas diazotrophica]TCK47685.1 exodeoxyribonuclease I subunit C [Celerinatantimonas diazotrophica]CAG9296690.1 Exodeoxyribonuclease I [Celerinatantimonas diazotrophica]
MTDTFLFHDYETFGTSPAFDRPAQFAAIRTDSDLNPIGEPIELYSQIANDYVPDPQACLITGITPQLTVQKGICEARFIAQINTHFSQPQTCGVGYNNIRFDDEVTRYTLYRNFYDPYAREWQNGNSRWDLIDVTRAFYALRPEGINWPTDEQGLPSFRLEKLTAANGVIHDNAHDALADVEATIALAKLLKKAQPKLFDFALSLRDKRRVATFMDFINQKPLVHVSGMFGAKQGCVSWVLPMAWHPTNKNAVIAIDLNQDVSPLFELDGEQIKKRLYTPKADLDGEPPIPVKLIHINKCPFVAPAGALSSSRADELGLDRQQCRLSLEKLKNAQQIRDKLIEVFSESRSFENDADVDGELYSGFIGKGDKALMEMLHSSDPAAISKEAFIFEDKRLNQLLLRYKARNYPYALTDAEQQQWMSHRQSVLPAQIEKRLLDIETLAQTHQHEPAKLTILKSIYHYIESL